MASNHDPRRLAEYLDIHETWMERLRRDHFIVDDDLALDANIVDGAPQILMKGRIRCAGNIFIDVRKTLRVIDGEGDDALVQTVAYTYHARVDGVGDLLRYCSPHADHRKFHHKHTFDPFKGDASSYSIDDEPGTCDATSDTNWPTLGEVLHEVRRWYFENITQLAERGAFK